LSIKDFGVGKEFPRRAMKKCGGEKIFLPPPGGRHY
jgi:hypothetical protein